MTPEPVVLIDVMNLVFRQHWALPNLMCDGKHTGVQYGVLKTILQLRQNISTRMIFVWDHGVPIPGAQRPRNWREDLLPSYKSNRKSSADLHSIVFPQLKDLHDVIRNLGYSHVSEMGLEADDLIGVLSLAYPQVFIFSTDGDFYQLLNKDRVRILVPKKEKGSFRIITQDDVEKEYDIPISRFSEYLALGGDSADNIKPMRGMGPKTAIKLIQSGVMLDRPLNKQPKEFQEKYGHVWQAIQNSYHAARIPVSVSDPRISSSVTKFFAPFPGQSLVNVQAFEKFMAERNMVSLLSARRSFYDTSNSSKQGPSQPCQPTSKPNPVKSFRKTLI